MEKMEKWIFSGLQRKTLPETQRKNVQNQDSDD